MVQLKTVVVMGGTSGIGEEICAYLAKSGYSVAALGPAPVREDGGYAVIETDVDDIASYPEAMDKANRRLGSINILVNACDRYEPVQLCDITPHTWANTLNYNLKSVFFSSQAVVPYMKDNGGIIINFSSVRGYLAAGGQIPYSAAKCGVAAMTRDLATDLGRYSIKCNSLMLFADGARDVLTQDSPKTKDVCEAVAFLMSEGSYYSLDAFDYPLDGGMSILLEGIKDAAGRVVEPEGSKVAVITGGAGGLGGEAARIFAKRGIRIAMLDILDEEGEALAKEIKEYADAEYYHCDVSSNKAIRDTVEAVAERFGRIDILLNAAAITSRKRTPEITEADWDIFMDIDLKGPFYMAMECARQMKKSGGGRIINFSSMLSTLSHGRHTLYGSAKEALNSMTRALGAVLKKDNIQVYSVLPAYVITPMISFRLTDKEWIARNYRQSLSKVLLYPNHVTDVFHYLATSATGDYTSGHKIYVDTGYLNFRYKLVPWDEQTSEEEAN